MRYLHFGSGLHRNERWYGSEFPGQLIQSTFSFPQGSAMKQETGKMSRSLLSITWRAKFPRVKSNCMGRRQPCSRKGPGTFERVKKTRVVALCWQMKSMACNDAGETERGPTVDYVKDVRLYLRSQGKLLQDLKQESSPTRAGAGKSIRLVVLKVWFVGPQESPGCF